MPLTAQTRSRVAWLEARHRTAADAASKAANELIDLYQDMARATYPSARYNDLAGCVEHLKRDLEIATGRLQEAREELAAARAAADAEMAGPGA